MSRDQKYVSNPKKYFSESKGFFKNPISFLLKMWLILIDIAFLSCLLMNLELESLQMYDVYRLGFLLLIYSVRICCRMDSC